MPKHVPPLEQPVAIVMQQPQVTPPPQKIQPSAEETPSDSPVAPRVVAVTANSPQINFAVPTIGNLLVANAVASAPPPTESLNTAPAQYRAVPKSIGSTGAGGDRPQPPYPETALKLGQQGTVILLLTVDDSGLARSVTVKETSGFPILDRATREFIKRHWIVPPGPGGRVFEATISYRIQTD